jgi:hypothetical protein
MREANFMVDRDTDKATPKEAADFLARASGLAGPKTSQGWIMV